jgi:hypothetical protein
MNRSRASLKSALAGVTLLALAGFATAAHAQAPAAADPAAGPTAATAPATAAPTPASAPTRASAQADVTLDSQPETSHRTAWPWIIIGTGVALVITATVLEVHAVSEDDQRQSAEIKFTGLPMGDPKRQPLVDLAASHDKSASTSRTEALIIGSVGFVAIAGAVVLWFVEGGSSSASTATRESAASGSASSATTKRKLPSILPRVAPGYAGAMLGATF